MKQNNPCYMFGMYEPDTDSVIINTGETQFLLSVARNVIPLLSLMTRMISYIFTCWQRKRLCCMLSWQ